MNVKKPDRKRVVRIGTRTSMMALAQTRRVIAHVQQHYPEIEFEICGILSSGDKDKTTPIWQMGQVGVFTHELDEQLLTHKVDCTIHSFKDLGTKRPIGIKTAALLQRDNPRDVILFHPDILNHLHSEQDIILGTSSPRRMTLLPEFLMEALPVIGSKKVNVRAVSLRGNANTRIEKLHRQDGGISAIALALAGLSRLFCDAQGREQIAPLLKGIRWMVAPLTVCPAAPGQGVICVEACEDRDDILEIFKSVHDKNTEKAVLDERNILISHGGGCHQKFGATKVTVPNLAQDIMIIRGETEQGLSINENRWQKPEFKVSGSVWDGMKNSDQSFEVEELATPLQHKPVAFIAHSRAVPSHLAAQTRVWVSGVSSWKKLAKKGIWVEGCADGFGFNFIKQTMCEPVLGLPSLTDMTVYTHEQAARHWDYGDVVSVYRLVSDPAPALIEKLKDAAIAWWVSDTQYMRFAEYAGHIKLHACGAGRTAEILKKKNVGPLAVFPSYDEFIRWINAK